jgi:hypothetical protein
MPIFTVFTGVPAGNYTGQFMGVEAQPENKQRGYPPGVRWKFTIIDGPFAGQVTSRITGAVPSAANICGRMLSGLIGRALAEGEQINPDVFIGKRYTIGVGVGEGGGTRVESIMPTSME